MTLKGEEKITFADFDKVELRVGQVLTAQEVAESDKLIALTVDIGDKVLTIFAGLKNRVEVTELVGRQVLVCTNLQERKMRFGTSQGMLLAAGDDAKAFPLSPWSALPPGTRVY